MIAQQTRRPTDEFSMYVYRFGWWICTVIAGFWLYSMIIVSAAVMIEWLLIAGNHWFGSATWPSNGIVRAFFEGDWITELRFPIFAAFFTLGGTMLSLERHPITLGVWSLACFALHVMLIGAVF